MVTQFGKFTKNQRASLAAQTVKSLSAVRETWVRSLGWEGPLEEGMATHSSILVWRIPMDRGAWWATVHVVAESDMTEQLSTAQQEKAEEEGVWEQSHHLHLATESYDHVQHQVRALGRLGLFPSRWSFHPTTMPYSNCSPNVCFPYYRVQNRARLLFIFVFYLADKVKEFTGKGHPGRAAEQGNRELHSHLCLFEQLMESLCSSEKFALTRLIFIWKHTSLEAPVVKNPPAEQETLVWFFGREDPLEEGMATHSSILAWRIPWTGEPGGLQSMENSMERGAWQATVHGIAKSWTWL